MYYNGYNPYEIYYQHQPHHGMCGECSIYPAPFMPTDPIYAHAYVPYQTYTVAYPLDEALMKGTMFPELAYVYNPYADYWKEEK